MAPSEDALHTVKEPLSHVDSMETQVKTVAAEPCLFGRYRLIRELGRGGGGIVWLARDEVLEIPVALKLVPDAVVHDTEGIIDLKKEVLRGMALTHPGIVRVFSFEQDGTSAAIVMEYVDGQTLADHKLQQEGRCFDCDEVRPWLEQLCAALDYAHREACIAHRDLKPRNIMVAPSGRVKIADFGIASSLTDSLSRVSVRVDSSGTPPYMSPQQAMGERPSHLDDIYSLGATIYELLTGKPPFFRGDILAQLLHEDAPSMTERRVELGISGKGPIPETWEKLVAACLSKEPTARPESGAAALAFLNSKVPASARSAVMAESVSTLPSDTLDADGVSARSQPTYSEAWDYEPVPEPSQLLQWLRTLVTVIIASALSAAVIHGVRKWTASAAMITEQTSNLPPTSTQPPSPAVPARPNVNSTAARPPEPRAGRLTTGTLDQPPEGPSPRRGPRHMPPPPPSGRP